MCLQWVDIQGCSMSDLCLALPVSVMMLQALEFLLTYTIHTSTWKMHILLLFDHMDHFVYTSPPDSFSWKYSWSEVKWKCESLNRVQLFSTPWTVSRQVSLPIEFSRREWSGLPFPSPGDRTWVSWNAGRFFVVWANPNLITIDVIWSLRAFWLNVDASLFQAVNSWEIVCILFFTGWASLANKYLQDN